MISRPQISCFVELTLNDQPAKAMWRTDRQTFTVITTTNLIGGNYTENLTLAALEQSLHHHHLEPTPTAIKDLARLGQQVKTRHGTAQIIGSHDPKTGTPSLHIITPDKHIEHIRGQWQWGTDPTNTDTAKAVIKAAFSTNIDLPNTTVLAQMLTTDTFQAIPEQSQWAADLNHIAHFAYTHQPPRIDLENNATRQINKHLNHPQPQTKKQRTQPPKTPSL